MRNYDLVIEITNPLIDEPDQPEFITVGVNFTTYGEFRDETWGYNGGTPAEYPEIDEVWVYDLATDTEIKSLDASSVEEIHEAIHEFMMQYPGKQIDMPVCMID